MLIGFCVKHCKTFPSGMVFLYLTDFFALPTITTQAIIKDMIDKAIVATTGHNFNYFCTNAIEDLFKLNESIHWTKGQLDLLSLAVQEDYSKLKTNFDKYANTKFL